MNKALGIALVIGALAVGGCSSNQADKTDTAVSSTSAASCNPPNSGTKPELSAIVAPVALPSGMKLLWTQSVTNSDDRSKVSVMVHLCGTAITSGDQLRPVATDYAKAFRVSPIAETIKTLYVSTYKDDQLNNETTLKVDNYQVFLWNGKPSAEAELQHWEQVHGS